MKLGTAIWKVRVNELGFMYPVQRRDLHSRAFIGRASKTVVPAATELNGKIGSCANGTLNFSSEKDCNSSELGFTMLIGTSCVPLIRGGMKLTL
jgi:hypothetical protein